MSNEPTWPALLVSFLVAPFVSSLAGAAEPNGWSVRYSSNVGEVHGHASAAALLVGGSETPHPALRARGWTATYDGIVALPRAGSYRFGIEVEGGSAEIRVTGDAGAERGRAAAASDGTSYTAWLEAGPGPIRVNVVYRRGARGDGRLRTLWEEIPTLEGGFRSEPIPTAAVVVPVDSAEPVARSIDERTGRMLLERKGCTNCHVPDAMTEHGVGRRPAPNLNDLGARVGADWTRRWIASPHALRPRSDMPDLFAGANAADEQEQEDILHFLMSGAEAPAPSDASLDLRWDGRTKFHTLGCVACHGPLEPASVVFADPLLPSSIDGHAPVVAYGDLDGKWHGTALVEFLKDPRATRPDGAMPSFDLGDSEARAIASYLTSRFPAPTGGFAVDAARAGRGREAFVRRSCHACHDVDGMPEPVPTAKPLHALSPEAGCMDPHDGATPRYDLSDDERRQLARGIESLAGLNGTPSPIDRSLRTFERLSCNACHRLAGRGGVPRELDPFFITLDDRVDLGDEGRVPPDLAGVGFKLTTPWFRRVLVAAGRARPYMGARMPQFGDEHVGALPVAFAAQDGIRPEQDMDPPPPHDSAVLDGRRLVGRDGMSCVTCHSFTSYPPAGSPGPSIEQFAERLRYEWWRAYIQAPARYKPGTRMPSFSLGRRSTVENVAGGDIYAQADAMWAYFDLGDAMPAPAGLEAPGAFKIDVDDRPVILRTFLENAGSRGIAIGFPVGIHFGFDAEACRLADAWSGDFLDASGAWAGRGGQVAGGQGKNVWTAAKGAPLVLGERPERWPESTGREAGFRFKGYRLDRAGVPTLLYEVDGVPIGERIEPKASPSPRFERRFELSRLSRPLWINAGRSGARITEAFGCRTTPRDAGDGVVWFEIEPELGASSVRFALEVSL